MIPKSAGCAVPSRKPALGASGRLAKALGSLGAAAALYLAGAASADTIQVQNVELESADERYVLRADFLFELTPPLLEALNNGVSLSFLVEFELTRRRWYWFDEKTASEKLELRLSYFPLAQQYRLSSGTLHLNFGTLAEALKVLGSVQGWRVLDRDRIENGERYIGSVRMRLDTARLPKPIQLSAVTNREWTLMADWKRFPFAPLAPVLEAR
jgi:hypothetical protein